MPSGPKTRSRTNASNGRPAARAIKTPSTSDPVLYIHRSPGWCMSGSVPRRRIHSSGAGGADGLGGPWPSDRSLIAFWMGYVSGGAMTMPKPIVKAKRSRTVIGRIAGTVSWSGPSSRFRTLRSASSGSSRSTGSSRRSLHSSTRIIAAAAVTGLVIDEMRKIVSRRIGSLPPTAVVPIASTCTSPRRLTSVTRPGAWPPSTCPATTSCMRPSRASDNPPAIIGSSPACESRRVLLEAVQSLGHALRHPRLHGRDPILGRLEEQPAREQRPAVTLVESPGHEELVARHPRDVEDLRVHEPFGRHDLAIHALERVLVAVGAPVDETIAAAGAEVDLAQGHGVPVRAPPLPHVLRPGRRHEDEVSRRREDARVHDFVLHDLDAHVRWSAHDPAVPGHAADESTDFTQYSASASARRGGPGSAD